MIELTNKAVEQLKLFSETEGVGHYCIRLKVLGGGCSGMKRDMIFEEKEFITDMDEVFEQNGITIIVDCLSLSYLGETTIDYINSDFGGGFTFVGPENYKNCGCGSSFSPL